MSDYAQMTNSTSYTLATRTHARCEISGDQRQAGRMRLAKRLHYNGPRYVFDGKQYRPASGYFFDGHMYREVVA